MSKDPRPDETPRTNSSEDPARHPLSTPHRGSLLVIFLTVFIDLLGFGIVLPLLPIYGKHFAEQHQWSDSQVGWMIGLLMSSFSAMQFLFLPVWGRLSDRYGRRPILMVGLAGSTFFYSLFGFATMWHSLAWLFVARIGAGIAGATISTAQAYIADTTTPQHRAKGMAMIGAAFALGFTLGPLIGAVALFFGEQIELSPWPGYVAAGLSGIALVMAIFWLPESWYPGTHHAERHLLDRSGLRTAMSTPSIGLLLLTSFIAVFSFANFESTLSLLIKNMLDRGGDGEFGTVLLAHLVSWIERRGYDSRGDVELVVVFATFAYLGIVLTLAQGLLVRRLATRVSESAMLVFGALMAIAGFLLLGQAANHDDYNLLLFAMAIEVIGFAFVNPSLQSLISRRTSPQSQGGVLGLSQSVSSLARILGPVFGLRLFTQSVAMPYYVATGLMGLGLVLMIFAARGGKDFAA
jgi:MFS family permease